MVGIPISLRIKMKNESIMLELLKEELVKGSRKIFAKKLVQRGEGNVSIRIPNTNEFLITPTYNDYANMNKDDVVHMNCEGKKLAGLQEASSEYRMHIAIYEARPRVNAIIHTHSPYASMLAIARQTIPPIIEEMVVWIGGEINCANFGEANTEEIGTQALKAIGNTNATLIANHGVLVCGKKMDNAIKTAELVEKMAFIYKGAKDLGEVHTISDTSFKKFRKKFEEYYSTL